MEIVRTYSDAGKSGLNIRGRDALLQLIEDVQAARADFQAILVYDVSRWGRFQDADESAYYEYICKRANIAVHYCAEQFANDGSLPSTLLKTIKRTMAGEYSRELSVKVFAGQCRLIELGFTTATFHVLRKMKPVRQVEAAELMLAAHNYSVRYAKLLLAGTAANMLLEPEKHRPTPGLSADQQRTIEREMDAVLRDLKTVEANYGEDVVTLTVSCRYIAHLLTNSRVNRYLTKNHADLLAEIRSLLAAIDLEKSPPPSGPVTAALVTARQSQPNSRSVHT